MSQTIPNPNRDRLGFPPPQTPEPADKKQRPVQSERAHAEALAYSEDLVLLTRRLRDELKAGSGPFYAAFQVSEKIAKLARKLRGRLQSA